MKTHHSHDSIFKEVESIKKNAADFINGTFPKDIKSKLDLNSLALTKDSFIDEDLKHLYSDLVYSCKYKGKKSIHITLLFEHKSFLPANPYSQLFLYYSNIIRHYTRNKQPWLPVLMVVFYHGKQTWKLRPMYDYFQGIDETLKRFIPHFDYLLVDLKKYTNKEILDSLFEREANKMLMLTMKHIFNKNILLNELENIFKTGKLYYTNEEGKQFIRGLILYLFSNLEDKERIIKSIRNVSTEEVEEAMTVAAKLHKEGLEKGLEEGFKEGELHDKQHILIKQITRKFGITEVEEKTIKATRNIDKLEKALDEILFAETKEEIMDYLK